MPKTMFYLENKKANRFAETLTRFLSKSPKTGKPVTQQELADYLGMKNQTISGYTLSKTEPNINTLLKIAEFFDVTVDELITGLNPEYKDIREILHFTDKAVNEIKKRMTEFNYMPFFINALLSDSEFFDIAASAGSNLLTAESLDFENIEDIKNYRPSFYEWLALQSLTNYFMKFLNAEWRKEAKEFYKEKMQNDFNEKIEKSLKSTAVPEA